jgi:putative ATP-binding cassette transporter
LPAGHWKSGAAAARGLGMTTKTNVAIGELSSLVRSYWFSEERLTAWGLLGAIVGLSLGTVYVSVRLNAWNAQFFDAIQQKEWSVFVHELVVFCGLATAFIVCAVYAQYLNQLLQIRWRSWLTERYLREWLRDKRYYRLQLIDGGTDNPDQRIAEDLRILTDTSLSLFVGLLRSVATVFSFTAILWGLSGPMSFTLAGAHVIVPGYLVWTAVVYSIAGTWLTHRIGAPLVRLNYDQQRVEADFRYALARLRENVDAVALFGGEQAEGQGFATRLHAVIANWRDIMRSQKRLTWFTSGYAQAAIIFPYVVVSPRYFSGNILLGGLTQTADAFTTLQGSLSWFVDAYSLFAQWRATGERLAGFQRAIDRSRWAAHAPAGMIRLRSDENAFVLVNLSLELPDGRLLIEKIDAEFVAGDSVLITGPSGTGKSTLLRAIAGIWPFGSGTIRCPRHGRMLFVPQKPYLPLGTLRAALFYPQAPRGDNDEFLSRSLVDCGLPHLMGRLDETRNWGLELSGGEQQRIAFCRALIVRPEWLFLDEATSGLDQASEAQLYRLLRRELPGSTIISVGHRPSLANFHARRLELESPRVQRTVRLPENGSCVRTA